MTYPFYRLSMFPCKMFLAYSRPSRAVNAAGPGELRQQGMLRMLRIFLQMARESETKKPPFHIEEFKLDHLDTADADCS